MTTTADERHPATDELRLVKVLGALADPVRVAIVRTLAGLGESPCVELRRAAELTIGQPTFSHHQRVLREAGVLRERVQGAQRIVSLRGEDLDACFPGLLTAVLATHPDQVR
ncbi:ArsR/SmtB family transcription factor [Streptacidiphilus jiangxiensis]|uniref:DNA-binding transcriptional regulator, ArsR family n=1 Tax=Streptacidiphilus jiangxiensis TaxID=235985 RepID=A0A1H7RII0_STRJI|nr:metalloregulator ArsR/SmtB family transcription factor [Streptacidiphilus jiangxiensis]SEL59993.1 DNA-binding transcriptional regulator, ArsR family [Streptacidiphilus jiangxiensis]